MASENLDSVAIWHNRVQRATLASHQILAEHESSAISRTILLEELLSKLSGLPVDIQDYFQESTVCLRQRLFRAAVVMSWAGFFHVLSEKIFTEHQAKLRAKRPKWKSKDLSELKEYQAESQLLDAFKAVGGFSRVELKKYQGQLATRNQCAHPTLFKPSLNAAIGYVDEMIRQATRYL